MFKPLTFNEIIRVAELQIGLIRGLLGINNVTLTATPAAIAFIARLGFDTQYGARPIKRVIQKQVLNELSKMILDGTVDRDAEIEMDEKEGKLIYRNR